MQKSGERYAAARHALLRQRDATPTRLPTVPGYAFARGLEDDHARLASALAQAGVVDPATGAPFTETRLFGLSGGIGFMAFLFRYEGHAPMLTFVCRSWSMPGPVVARALEHAGIAHARSETGSAKAASAFVEETLARGVAALVSLDWASLPWSGVPDVWVGGMPRQANVVGRDGDAYVLDVGAPVRLSPSDLARVRAAPKKEKHRAYRFEAGPAAADPVAATRAAVRSTAKAMVEAPYASFASSFGLAALEKQARLGVDTEDKRGWPQVFASGPLACRALLRTWEGLTLELTAPAGGRQLYADFFAESARLPGLGVLGEASALAQESAALFARLTDDLVAAAPEVAAAVTISEQIDELRRSGAGGVEGAQVAALHAQREAVVQRCDLDAEARMAAFARVGEAFAAIHEVEARLQGALAAV